MQQVFVSVKQIVKNKMSQRQCVLLGRWNIEQCEKKIHMKIDLSNEDHCGVCINGKSSQIGKKSYSFDDKDEDYIRYFMV